MPTALNELGGYNSQTYASGTSSTSGKTSEEILEELGIPVKKEGENAELDFEDYLQLMVQQLQNQTMDNTMDSSAMMDQLVQMSSVQMMASLKTSMDTVADAVTLSYASSLVGKTVTVGELDDDGKIQEVVGTVTGTGTYQGAQVIFVNDKMYALSDIMAIGTLPEIPEEPDTGEGGEGEDSGTGDQETAQSL